jgi:hypothetical protein
VAKPTSLPRWASTVTGDTTRVQAPTSGRQDVGWAPGERPPAQHLNWLLNIIYQWLAYLNGLAGEAITWTAAHVFSSTVSFPGGIIGAITFNTAPTAPDYHISSARSRIIHPAKGELITGVWIPFNGGMTSVDADSASVILPLDVEYGEVMTVYVALLQTNAVAGGTARLYRVNAAGTVVLVSSVDIPSSAGSWALAVVTDHAIVADQAYSLTVSFAAGAGTKEIFQVKCAVTR